MCDFIDLHRDANAAAHCSEPPGPKPATPQTPGFDETEGGISESAECQQLECLVVRLRRSIEEDAGKVMRGIEVRVPHQHLGHMPDVPMNEPQQAEAGQQNERTFRRLEGGDDTDAFPDQTHSHVLATSARASELIAPLSIRRNARSRSFVDSWPS